jgi:hypothetical protein
VSATQPQPAARRRTRGGVVVLLGCGVVLVAEFLWFQQQRRELETFRDAWRAALEVKTTENKLSRAREELKTASARAKEAPSTGRGGMSILSEEAAAAARRKKAVEDSAEFERRKALRQKLGVASRYAPLFDELQLDQAGREALTLLLLNKENFSDDFNAAYGKSQSAEMFAAMKTGDPAKQMEVAMTSITAVKAAIKQAREDLDNSFKSALGDDGYRLYSDFEKHLPQHLAVIELQQSVAGTEEALSRAQCEALAQLFTEKEVTRQSAPPLLVAMPPWEAGQYGAGGQRYLEVGYSPFYADAAGTVYGTYLPHETEVSRAAAFLGPAQLAGLRKLRETKQARVDLEHTFQRR